MKNVIAHVVVKWSDSPYNVITLQPPFKEKSFYQTRKKIYNHLNLIKI